MADARQVQRRWGRSSSLAALVVLMIAALLPVTLADADAVAASTSADRSTSWTDATDLGSASTTPTWVADAVERRATGPRTGGHRSALMGRVAAIDPVAPDPTSGEPTTDPVETSVVPEPVASEPVVSDPVSTDPVSTDPVVVAPTVTDPAAGDPVSVDPAPVDPAATSPTDPMVASTEGPDADMIAGVVTSGAAVDASGSGTPDLALSLAAAAAVPATVTNVGTADDPVLVLSDGADTVVLEYDAALGRMVLRSLDGQLVTYEFDAPSGSLTIRLGGGDDTITVTSLSPGWSALVEVIGEDGEDATVVGGIIRTLGGAFAADTERVQVTSGGAIITGVDGADSGAITLGAGRSGEDGTGRTISVEPGALLDAGAGPGLSAGDVTLVATDSATVVVGASSGTDLRASVTVTGAIIRGADVSIAASATDTPIVEGLGDYADPAMNWLYQLLGQLPGLALSLLTGVSGQVTVRSSTAEIRLTDSGIVADGSVSVGTTASADASMHITSVNGAVGNGKYAVSIGYGAATATALTLVTNTTIRAGGSVDLTSSATTKAFVKARTTVSPTVFAASDNITLAIAVAHTTETSKVVVDARSVIDSGGTVNIAAEGTVTNFAWAQPVVNEDGLLTVAFAFDFDTADIRAEVAGTITAAGGVDLSFDVPRTPGSGSWVDFVTDTIRLPGHGLAEGQEVVYDSGTVRGLLGAVDAPALGGLEDGATYFVRVIDADTIALTTAASIDLERRLSLFGPASSTQTIGKVATLDVTSAQIDPGSDQIRFATPHGLADGTELFFSGTYQGTAAQGTTPGIPGLQAGRWYRVARLSATVIRLLELDGTAVDLTGQGAGRHGFLYRSDIRSFDPSVAVDADRNTITFTTPHGFTTGDALWYRTDPAVSGSRPTGTLSLDRSLTLAGPTELQITGDLRGMVVGGQRIVVTVGGVSVDTFIAGVSFDAAVNRTIVRLLAAVAGTGPVSAVVTLPGLVSVPDEPIPGLQDDGVYYAVVVDAVTIRLATGREAALLAATPIDLSAPEGGGVGQVDPHSLSTNGCTGGICITAGLTAVNAINAAGAIAGGSTTPWADAVGTFTGNIGSPEEVLRQIVSLIRWGATGSLPSGALGSSGVGLAGSIAVNRAVHDVVALVAPTAVLTSAAGITIGASITQYSQVAVVAGATKQQDDDDQTVAQVALSLAIGIGLFRNTALAVVDSGARVDAADSLTVSSSIDYPYLISSLTSAVNPAEYLKSSGPDGYAYFFDGTLGFSSNLFNTWVMTAASQAKVAGGGSVAALDYVNRSEAVIRSGAVINSSTDPAQVAGDRGVTVEAALSGNFIHIVGVAGLSLHNLVGGVDAWRSAAKGGANAGGKVLASFKSLVNPFGAEGDKAGIGASFLVQKVDNRAEAWIASGARVTTGVGGLSVAASTTLTDFALAEAGSKASTFAVAGAFTVLELANRTWAHIEAGADVRSGGDVTVTAEDVLDRLAVAGGIVAVDHVGIGVGVGINIADRDTRAWIDGASAFVLPILTPDGAVLVSARNGGALTSAVIGGALAGSTINNAGQTVQPPTTPNGELPGFDLGGKPSVAVGLSIAVNVVDRSEVRAWVQDRTVAARRITVSAVSDPTLLAVVVAAAFAVDTPSSSTTVRGASIDVSIAGALAVNLLTHEVEAALRRARIGAAEDVTVTATDSGSITVVAGALSVAVNVASMGEARAVGIGGSVAVNDIATTVSAVVEDSTVNAVGDVVIIADASPRIVSHTYAASVTVAKGAGLGGTDISVSGSGAGSGNRIDRTVTAAVRGSTITARGVVVRAVDAPSILAVAVGIAVAVAGDGVAVGIGIAAARNEILGSVTASVGPSAAGASTVTATGWIGGDVTQQLAIRIVVDSSPVVESYTISGALGGGQGQSAGGAGAGSGNYITSTGTSSVTGGSTLSATSGGVEVSATDRSSITAVAGALAIAAVLALSGGSRGPPVALAIGVTVAVNRISVDVVAVVDGSSVTAPSAIQVLASARPSIQALTLAGAFGINLAQGGSFSFSGSLVGAIALNDIDDQVEALVRNGASLTSTSGSVTIRAAMADGSGIRAVAVGAAASVSSGSGATIGLDIGVAIAVNRIGSGRGNLVLARITGSVVDAERTVSLVSRMSAEITAVVVAAAVAITISTGQAAVALSGAGAVARNTIGGQVLAEVVGAAVVTARSGGGWVLVQADERTSISSQVVAATVTVSAAVSGASVSGSIAYAESTNTHTTAVRATVSGRSLVQAVQGGVAVVARSGASDGRATRFFAGAAALSVGVAITNPLQGVAVGLNGVAALASNTLRGTVDVVIDGGALVSSGGGGLPAGTACVPSGPGANSLLVCSFQQDTARAEVIGGALEIAIGLSAVVAVGLATNTVTVGSRVTVDGAIVASNGAVLVGAYTDVASDVSVLVFAVAIAVGGAGAGGRAESTVTGSTAVVVGNGASITGIAGLGVRARTTVGASAVTEGGAGSVGSIAVMLAESVVGVATDVQVDRSRLASGGPVSVEAEQAVRAGRTATSTARLVVGSVAILSGAGGSAQARDRSTVRALILLGTTVVAPAGAVTVSALRTGVTDARTTGVNIGILAGLAATVRSAVTGETVARIAPAVSVSANSLSVVARADTTATTSQLGVCVGGICAAVSIEAADGDPSAAADDTVLALVGAETPTGVLPDTVRIQVNGLFEILALGSRTVTADTRTGAGGAIAAAVGLVWARSNGATRAVLGSGVVVVAGSLTIRAAATRTVDATSVIGQAGVLGGAGGRARATIGGTTEALVLSSVNPTALVHLQVGGETQVTAEATNKATAEITGGSGNVALGVTAFFADATVGRESTAAAPVLTRAAVAAGVRMTTGSLRVTASSADDAEARIPLALTLALALSGNGGRVRARTDLDVEASLGELGATATSTTVVRAAPDATGLVTISAGSRGTADAEIDAGGGSLALDVTRFEAESRMLGTTSARIGDRTDIPTAGTVRVTAVSTATASADAAVGSGAAISIAEVVVTVVNSRATVASVGAGVRIGFELPVFNNVLVSADGTIRVYGNATAAGGGVIRVGSPQVTADLNPTVAATVGRVAGAATTIDSIGGIAVTAELRGSPFDGPSRVFAGGGSGGVLEFAFPSALLRSSTDVRTTIAAALTSRSNIRVTATTLTSLDADADTAGGGVISVTTAKATADAGGPAGGRSIRTTVELSTDARLSSGGDVLVEATADGSVSATATSLGGAAIKVSTAIPKASLNQDTSVLVREGVTVAAVGHVALRSISLMTVTSSATTQVWVLGGLADSNCNVFNNDSQKCDGFTGGTFIGAANDDALTLVSVGARTSISGRTVDIEAAVVRLVGQAFAKAESYPTPLATSAYANAFVDVYSVARVELLARLAAPSTIDGAQGVDISATQSGVDIYRWARRLALGFAQVSVADGTDSLRSEVSAQQGLTVRAGPRIDADAGRSGLAPAATTVPRLALYVGALVIRGDGVRNSVGRVTDDVDEALFDFRKAVTTRDNRITWDATAEIAAGPSPELIVNESGEIVREVGLTATVCRVTGPGCATPGIFVDPIYARGGAGQALLNAPGGVVTETPGKDAAAVPYWGRFRFLDSFSRIYIENRSDLDLHLGPINTVFNEAAQTGVLQPALTGDIFIRTRSGETRDGITVRFAVERGIFPTTILIENFGPSDVILPGRALGIAGSGTNRFVDTTTSGIENPIGTTTIRAHRGDILMPAAPPVLPPGVPATDFAAIRGVVVDLWAPLGDVRGGADGVSVDVVNTTSRPIVLRVLAGGRVELSVRGRNRTDAFPSFGSLDPNGPEMTVRAGSSVDIALRSALWDFVADGVVRPVQVKDNDLPLAGYRCFYRPDPTCPLTVALDRGAYVGSSRPSGTTMRFRLVESGGDITFRRVDFNIITTIDLEALTNIRGDGHVDADMDGSITIAEIDSSDPADPDDLRVGVIRSRFTVSLSAPHSIVDAVDDPTSPTDPADVIAPRIILVSSSGSIGSVDDFLETDLVDARLVGGVPFSVISTLTARGPSVFVTEVSGDLRVREVRTTGSTPDPADPALPVDIVLTTRSGSIVACGDGPFGTCSSPLDGSPDVVGRRIVLVARGGGVGTDAVPLEVHTERVDGRWLYVDADASVSILDPAGSLVVLGAVSRTGDLRVAVPDRVGALGQLIVVPDGAVVLGQGDLRQAVPVDEIADGSGAVRSGVWAAGRVELRSGTLFSALARTWIVAGGTVVVSVATDTADRTGALVVLGGHLGGEFDLGATPDSTDIVFLLTGDAVDTVAFVETFLGATTRLYAGAADDAIGVTRLQTIPNPDWTLTIDGQAGADRVQVITTGSTGPDRDYVVNVLDTGTDGAADTLRVVGSDGADLVLMRPVTSVPCVGLDENCVQERTAVGPAFVAVLHAAEPIAAPVPLAGEVSTPWFPIERITYSRGVEALTVEALGGDDLIAIDGLRAPTTVDAGAGADRIRVGQRYGLPRNAPNVAPENAFPTVGTVRGYLSEGASAPLVLLAGDGDDDVDIRSGEAPITVDGGDGGDSLTVRWFRLAQVTAAGLLVLDPAGGWTIPTADGRTTAYLSVDATSVESQLTPAAGPAPTELGSLLSRLERNGPLPAPCSGPGCLPDTCVGPACPPPPCPPGSATCPVSCPPGSASCPLPCTGPGCTPQPPCTGPGCPPPCTGPGCPQICTGADCPPPPCTGPGCPPPPCLPGSPGCPVTPPPPPGPPGPPSTVIPPPRVLTVCVGVGCRVGPGSDPNGSRIRRGVPSGVAGASASAGVTGVAGVDAIAWGGAESLLLLQVALVLLVLGLAVLWLVRRRRSARGI